MISTRDRLDEILARLAAGAGERVFLKLYADAARAAADAADVRRKAGSPLGPLDGAIVSVKDLFDVAGEATTAGSAILRTAAPAAADAVIVRRLRQAGAVIIGKTNMTEFAFTAIGMNPHYGMPGNAADASRIPGGSSSGAGVSAAEGSSDIAIGSDTGGSVRIPASLNGVVGFKPTASRVPLDGAYPLSHTLDSIGPLARTVAQCAAADAVMAGEAADPVPAAPLSGLRVGIPRGKLLDDLEPDVATAFAHSLKRLEAAGARIFDHPIDDLIAAMAKVTAPGSIASIEGAAVHADWLTSDISDVDPRVSGPLGRRLSVPAHIYIRMLRQRGELAAAMDDASCSGRRARAADHTDDRTGCRAADGRRGTLRADGGSSAAQSANRQPVRPDRDLATHAGDGIAGRYHADRPARRRPAPACHCRRGRERVPAHRVAGRRTGRAPGSAKPLSAIRILRRTAICCNATISCL